MNDTSATTRSGVTGLEHGAQLLVHLRKCLGAGLERLILDDVQAGHECAGLIVAAGLLVGDLGVAHGLRI